MPRGKRILIVVMIFGWIHLFAQDSPPKFRNEIIIKLASSSGIRAQSAREVDRFNLSDINNRWGADHVRKLRFKTPSIKSNSRVGTSSRIDNIYFIEIDPNEDYEELVKELEAYPNVIYAEPVFDEQLLFTPNDSNLGSQTGLELIKAFDAWDVTQGSESIVVGVSDTGVQLDHIDLQSNLFLNENDPINGLDDDGNGYVDDYQGWDFYDNDNDPSTDESDHGTQVAGVSSAVTNNGTGMAGVGFKSKFVPLKIFNSITGSRNEYESIVYAADQGYDVINLSWGSVSSYNQAHQDIIDYAVLDKDMVVVAAGGNGNAELVFYPASYNHVLSVANTNMSDEKSPGATYSYEIDLSAPGRDVFTTKDGNGFTTTLGSSFASPHVAGAAALVKSAFPDLNARQIMQQLRVTADDIYNIGNNNDYRGQLGKGRLNVFRAVTETDAKSIRLERFEYQNPFGSYAFFGDTLKVSLDFFNYLNPTSSAMASLSSENPNVIINHPNVTIGSLPEMGQSNSIETAIILSENAEHDERIIVRVDLSDGDYEDFDYFEFNLSPGYLDIDNQKVGLHVSNNGNLGYPNLDEDDGIGFELDGEKIAENLGLIVGNHPDSISDNVVRDLNSSSRDQDFEENGKIKFYQNSIADLYTKSTFDDSPAGNNSLGLLVEQAVLSWENSADNGYIIVEYRISNNTEKNKSGYKAAMFSDWNLDERSTNVANWDSDNSLAYSHNSTNSKFAGIALLSNQTPLVHSIDFDDQNGNSDEVNGDFTDNLKHAFINSEKTSAGLFGAGNDVAQLLAADLGGFGPYESKKVAFVLTAGNSLAELQANVSKAGVKYQDFIESPPINQFVSVCQNSGFTLTLDGGDQFEIFDDAVMSNLLQTGNDFLFDAISEDTLLYVRNVSQDIKSDIYRVKVEIGNPVVDFQTVPDTLFLGDNDINKVEFQDISGWPSEWNWTFDNGSFSTQQTPTVIYDQVGTYNVVLEVNNDDCQATVNKQVLVAERGAKPEIEKIEICRGESAIISASNSNELRVYESETITDYLFQGDEFITNSLSEDKTFYVSSVDDEFESLRVPVLVDVLNLNIDFVTLADTLDNTSQNQINFVDQSNGAVQYEWKVGGKLISTNEIGSFNFTDETSIEVTLAVTNSLGCWDTKTKTVQITDSAIPDLSDVTVCEFDDVIISADNSDILYVYDSPNAVASIYRGQRYTMKDIQQNKTLYVAGVDGLKESPRREVNVSLFPSEIGLSAAPDTLILSQGRSVEFAYSSTQIIQSNHWFINEILSEIVDDPVITFDEAGNYNIELVTKDQNNCIDTTRLNYPVLNVPITSIGEINFNRIRVFPNSAKSLITITSSSELDNLACYSSTGQIQKIEPKALDNYNYIIDVSSLRSGIYLISGEASGVRFSRKVIVKR